MLQPACNYLQKTGQGILDVVLETAGVVRQVVLG
jgi:hypothetical protein